MSYTFEVLKSAPVVEILTSVRHEKGSMCETRRIRMENTRIQAVAQKKQTQVTVVTPVEFRLSWRTGSELETDKDT